MIFKKTNRHSIFVLGSLSLLMAGTAFSDNSVNNFKESIKPTLEQNECQFDDTVNGRGCCSWHGGVCGCSGGRASCCDGTLSPSCGC